MSAVVDPQMLYCRACGKQVHHSAMACPGCGAVRRPAGMSEKKVLPAFLLCLFFGCFGFHRFYVGKVGTGLLQLFTLGGLGIWALVDFILIVVGAFTDKAGAKITQWT
jgi:TM2 domain-containing membrane protein YozV